MSAWVVLDVLAIPAFVAYWFVPSWKGRPLLGHLSVYRIWLVMAGVWVLMGLLRALVRDLGGPA